MITDNYKRFFIRTLGCKVNQYESQAMREILERAGYRESSTESMADVYIVNTCTVTDRADKESRHILNLMHRENPRAKIVVTGCYVERDAETLSFLPGITHVIRNADKIDIAHILDERRTTNDPSTPRQSSGSMVSRVEPSTGSGSSRAMSRDDERLREYPFMITDFKDHTKAFVKIQDGCENFCAYCKVPLVRSVLWSKPLAHIVDEVKVLVGKGFKEIVLAGICLGLWGRGLSGSGASLIDVLKALEAVPGDFRIRLSSIEPKHVTAELIDYIASHARMCRHLHIPLQSGDDQILALMHRPYTAGFYRELVGAARARMPDIAITTDIMTGFPGEGDEHHKRTLAFVKEFLPARTHIFSYSMRRGTAACDLPGEPDRQTKRRRYFSLKVAALSASYLYRRRYLNQKLDVLVENARDGRTGLLVGYSDNYIRVQFRGGDELMGRIIPVKVVDLVLLYTWGEL